MSWKSHTESVPEPPRKRYRDNAKRIGRRAALLRHRLLVEKLNVNGPVQTRLMEKLMEKTERTLRFTVEKWLAMAHARSARVRRGGHVVSNQTRCVCVEASISTGTFEIYLFRQADGTWCVFPPHVERAEMSLA